MIYLDNAATTPVLPEVVEAMERVMHHDFGNPSSRHAAGLAAERHLRAARDTVARRVGAAPERVLFTSGGTEANALAVLGTCRRTHSRHVLVSSVEHPSVLGCADLLEREGFEVTRAPVTAGGWVDPAGIEGLVRPDTALVAVMHTNNETGIVQPTAEAASAARRRAPECQVLVDAVQSLPALTFTLDELGADLLSLSAHKVHGPKGTGCLVLGPRASVAPLWGGGDQEAQLRPGTENLPGIVGFARALELLEPEPDRLAALSARLEHAVIEARPDAYPVGDRARRAPHLLAMAVPGVATEVLINLLESLGVCASSGSACHSRRTLRSHVTAAMGLPSEHGTVRLSLSTTTTDDEVARAAELVGEALGRL
jgi:cysteine desulfurase